MTWKREDGVYWSDCGRFCIQRTPSTAIGPWYVTHDPAGERAGWGRIIIPYANTLKEAKRRVEAGEF